MIEGKITGDKELDRKLKNLADKGLKRITRSIDGAMMTVFLRGVRNAVPPKYKSAKKALGRKAGKNKFKGIHETKFGFGVGKKAGTSKDREGNPGVGISKTNIHWLLLGSKDRVRASGATTGSMPAIGRDWLKRGIQAVQQEAERKAQDVARMKLIDEAKRL